MHYLQVTADININSGTQLSKAFKPGMVFLEANLPTQLVNELYLNLMFDGDETGYIEVNIHDPYMETMYHEFVVDYDSIACSPENDFSLRIDMKELTVSLRKAKEHTEQGTMYKDTSKFLIDFCETTLKIIKDKNELS